MPDACSSNRASGQEQEVGGGKITSGLATTDKWGIAMCFGTTTRERQNRDFTDRSFLHQRYKPSKPNSTSTESLTL